MNLLKNIVWTISVLICLSATQLLAQEGVVPQESDENSIAQTPDEFATGEDRQKQLEERFFDELDFLIPGEFEPDSAIEKGVRKAVSAFAQGDSPEATRQLEKLAKLDPAFPPVEMLQAGLVFAAGNPTQGFQILESASLKNPDYPGIYFAFGRLAISQKRFTDATALIEKAAAKSKAKSFSKVEDEYFRNQYYDAMIDIAMRQRQYDVARENLASLEAIDPQSKKIPVTKAELDFIDEKYDASFDRLKKFHKQNPKSNLPEIVMAQWFQSVGKLEDVGIWIGKAAEAYPNNPLVQLQFANFAVNTNNFPQANSAIKKIEDAIGKETPETILLRGKMAFADEAYGMAEVHYKKLMELQPNNFDMSNMYALSLIENPLAENQKLAAQIAQRNFQNVSDNQVAQAAYGWILWRLGDKQKAQALLTQAARKPPLAPEIAFFLATMMHDAGSSQQAKLVLEPAMQAPGLFLYRTAAERLLKKIDESTSDALPIPDKSDK